MSAQQEFAFSNKDLSFDDLQIIFEEARIKKDPLLRGMAWYKWAELAFRANINSRSGFEALEHSVKYLGQTTDSLAYHRARYRLAEQLARRGVAERGMAILIEVLAFARRIGNPDLEANALFQMYEINRAQKDDVQARHYRMLFDASVQKTPNQPLEFSALLYDVYRQQDQGEYTSALNLSRRALQLAHAMNDDKSIALAEYRIGVLSAITGESAQVLPMLLQAEKRCPPYNMALRRDIYQQLAQHYAANGNYQKAYFYTSRQGAMSDSLSVKNDLALHNRAIEYDADQKNLQIETLEGQNKEAEDLASQAWGWVLWLVGCLVVLAIIGYFINRSFRREKIIAEKNEALQRNKVQQLEDNREIENMKSMLNGQEEERGRVAKDLHDSLGGMLASAKMQLESLRSNIPALNEHPDALRIKGLFDEMATETRQIAHDLQAGTLHKFGLVAGLRDLCNRNKVAKMASITFQHFGELTDFDATNALQCYRIAQELLQNSVKHAQARNILVDITRLEDEIVLTVEDDGRGYDPGSVKQGMGTDNLASRVQFLKGTITVDSAPGKGTSTRVVIPINNAVTQSAS